MRINENYAYICSMKTRLNITIDNDLLNKAKIYAEKNSVSLSQLIESFLYSVTKPVSKNSIIQLIDNLPAHSIDSSKDLKKGYYEDQRIKYGI